MNMRDLERRAIEEALRRNNGNRTQTARELGISLRTLAIPAEGIRRARRLNRQASPNGPRSAPAPDYRPSQRPARRCWSRWDWLSR